MSNWANVDGENAPAADKPAPKSGWGMDGGASGAGAAGGVDSNVGKKVVTQGQAYWDNKTQELDIPEMGEEVHAPEMMEPELISEAPKVSAHVSGLVELGRDRQLDVPSLV